MSNNKPAPPSLNRIVWGMPDADYRKAPGVSNSSLKLLDRTPYHYKWAIDNPQPPTPAMRIGSAFHTATLEPEKYGEGKSHVFRPAEWDSWRTNASRDWKREQKLPILEPKDLVESEGMANAIRANPHAAAWLKGIRTEVVMFGQCPLTGLLRKARLDGLVGMEPVIIDIKTTEDASEFEKTAANYGYDIQEAYYRDICEINGVEIERFVFIVVEKHAPHGVRLVELDPEDVQRGRDVYRCNLGRLKRCVDSNAWPSYPEKPVRVSLPAWARTARELQSLAA